MTASAKYNSPGCFSRLAIWDWSGDGIDQKNGRLAAVPNRAAVWNDRLVTVSVLAAVLCQVCRSLAAVNAACCSVETLSAVSCMRGDKERQSRRVSGRGALDQAHQWWNAVVLAF